MSCPQNNSTAPAPVNDDGLDLDAEDLACLGGFRRQRDWFDEIFGELWANPTPAAAAPQRGSRQRKPSLASVAKQMREADVAVARYEVRPDGTVIIVTGPPEPSTESNPWPLDDFKATKQ